MERMRQARFWIQLPLNEFVPYFLSHRHFGLWQLYCSFGPESFTAIFAPSEICEPRQVFRKLIVAQCEAMVFP